MLLTVLNNRWKLVIHGGVDGFSRIPVYLRCSGNNQASTVLELFKEAVAEYGLPSRVRSDIRVEKTLKYHSLCFPIHREAQEGVA